MSIVTDYADLFSTSADGVSQAMNDWLANRPADPNLVPLWNLEFTRLGNTASSLRAVAAHLYNLDAQAVLASVQGELLNIQQATLQVQVDISQIHKIDNMLDVLAKFVTLGVSIAAFVAAPNPASAAALPGQIQSVGTAIQHYRQAETAAAAAVAAARAAAAAAAAQPAPLSFY